MINYPQKILHFIFIPLLVLWVLCYPTTLFTFHLKPGDLLFQDLNCGPLCRAITSVTQGIHQQNISHVAMVLSTIGDEPTLIEAMPPKVTTISLSQFLMRSKDQQGKPRVVVGRVRYAYRREIPAVIQFMQQQLGKPYNAGFIPNQDQSFYCSQLIAAAWQQVNHGKPFFPTEPMNFEDSKNHKPLPAWQNYFRQLHSKIPQGLPGTNPGQISRSNKIIILHWYGQLAS